MTPAGAFDDQRVSLALGSHQQAGDVVAAAGLVGGGYQAGAERLERKIG